MPSYIVVKRLQDDRAYMPGEIMVDPHAETAAILVSRGYITEIGDDIADKHANAKLEAGDRSMAADFVRQGYSEKAAEHLAKNAADSKHELPAYVQKEKAKVGERQTRLEDRTQAEVDRLSASVGGTADDILDLSDEDYKALLEEHPSQSPTAAADPEAKTDDDESPFEMLMAMSKEHLLNVMAEQSIAEPTADENWFKDNARHEIVVREILASAGYSGDALMPTPTEEPQS